MLPFLLQGAGIGIYAALSPGPYQSLVIAKSVVGGWRRAAPVILGVLVSDPPIAFVLVFVMSQVPAAFLRLVRLGGAALLLFLAWGLFRQMRRGSKTGKGVSSKPDRRSFLGGVGQGALMLFLSPGPYLFWGLVLGPLLLDALSLSIFHGVLFLAGFYCCSIGGLLLIAYVIGRLGLLSERSRRVLQVGSLLLMLVFALLLIDNGLTT